MLILILIGFMVMFLISAFIGIYLIQNKHNPDYGVNINYYNFTLTEEDEA